VTSNQHFTRRILVVDDEPIIRNLVAERLTQSGFETRTAPDALSAKRVMLSFDPDALVVDLDLGDGPSGTELIAALHAINPALGFLLLTNYTPTESELSSAKRIKYLNKREVSNMQLLIDELDHLLKDPELSVSATARGSRLSVLTPKQLKVLGLLAKGMTNQEISDLQGVGLRAIEQTIHRTYVALDLNKETGGSSRVAAARIYAAEMGLRRGKN
jgi:DNA-binding NarL/FixJ family response regulator